MILNEETCAKTGKNFKDVSKKAKVVCKCDYCGAIFERIKSNLLRSHKHTQTDSCTNKECIQKKKVESYQVSFGADSPFKCEEIRDKIEAKNIEVCGFKNPMQCPEIKKRAADTCEKNLGVRNPFQSEIIQKKIAEIIERDYGVKNVFQNKDVQAKQKRTIEKDYGVSHYSKTDEFKEKVKDTHNKRRGIDSNLQLVETQEQIKQTWIKIHGVDNPMKSEVIRQQRNDEYKKEHGVENPMQNEAVRQKAEDKWVETLGVNNPMKSEVIKRKLKDYFVETLGVENPMQDKGILQKARNKCIEIYGKYPAGNYGKTQNEIKEWVNSFGFNFQSDYKVLEGKELDLYDPEKKIALEYCGLYWHNELSPEPRVRRYHHDKYKNCLKQGIQLITIFSDEWNKRQFQCQSHIKAVLGVKDYRIYARNCIIKEMPTAEARKFFEAYHIQGSNKLSVVAFGLFLGDELVGVMSLGRHHRQYDIIVLDRLCFKDGVQVVGGASKLFKRCIEWTSGNKYQEIVSFSDNRWSIGKVYEALSFSLEREYGPDYSYVKLDKPNERLSKQSQKKSNVACPEELTEHEWALQRNLARVWDCGKKRWVYKIN